MYVFYCLDHISFTRPSLEMSEKKNCKIVAGAFMSYFIKWIDNNASQITMKGGVTPPRLYEVH